MKLKEFIGYRPTHCKDVGETYFEHLWWTIRAFVWLTAVAIIGLIHGIFPFIFADTPDRLILPWVEKFRARRVRTGQAARRPEKTTIDPVTWDDIKK